LKPTVKDHSKKNWTPDCEGISGRLNEYAVIIVEGRGVKEIHSKIDKRNYEKDDELNFSEGHASIYFN